MIAPMMHIQAPEVWNTDINAPYRNWREEKLRIFAGIGDVNERVELRDLAKPSNVECAELVRRCRVSNAVVYASDVDTDDVERMRHQLGKFSSALGLRIAEKHRSAGSDGIVSLCQSNQPKQRGYIPYSTKPMNWHSDGYYNSPDQKIRSMILHCICPAADGGVNQLFDPELAYLRLRDENPAYVEALMHPEAMTIPENNEPGGKHRPASVGPVFSVDPSNGHLEMRYTARTRSITWRQDAMTELAVEFLRKTLTNDDPYMQTTKIEAGEGILSNNSLHNRTGFDQNLKTDSNRLLLRIRFHNRIAGS